MALFIKNQYSNTIINIPVDIAGMREILENPGSRPKDQVPQWQFYTIREGAEYIRNQDNYDTVYALLLDYDGTITMQEFQERYQDIRYYLYTTSSHTDAAHKFRVIVPLDKHYPYAEIRDRIMREVLTSYFTGVDPSCWSNWHKMPNVQPGNHMYCWYISAAPKLSLDKFEYRCNKLRAKYQEDKAARAANRTNGPWNPANAKYYKAKVDESMRQILADIPTIQCGHRYRDIVSIVGKLINAKYPDGMHIYDDDEVESMVLGHTDTRQVRNLIYGACKSWR